MEVESSEVSRLQAFAGEPVGAWPPTVSVQRCDYYLAPIAGIPSTMQAALVQDACVEVATDHRTELCYCCRCDLGSMS